MFDKDPALGFNIDDPYSPHSIVLNLIAPRQCLLDVGRNTGYVGECFIKNKNCVCDGIDYDPLFLDQAKAKGYRHLFKINLYQDNFHLPEQYDVILFIDILEHLPNPHLILQKIISENLKPGGQAIICLPNTARLEHRLKHLFGQFICEKSGIMSQDHLRFFTKKTAAEMIEKTNLTIDAVLLTGLGARIRLCPKLTSFQFIFVCHK